MHQIENHGDVFCEICQKIKGSLNDTNWKRHIKYKDKEKKKAQLKRKNDDGYPKLTKFFKTAHIGVDAGEIVGACNIDNVCDITIDDVTAIGVEKYNDEGSIDSKENSECDIINKVENKAPFRKCEGYKTLSVCLVGENGKM